MINQVILFRKKLAYGGRQVAFGKFTKCYFHNLGHYSFTVCLKSDSYLGVDVQEEIKLEVAEARQPIEEHPQWEFEDDEEEEDSKEEESDDEFATDSEADEDDDE